MRAIQTIFAASVISVALVSNALASEGPGGRTFEVTRAGQTYTSEFAADGRYSDSLGGAGTWALQGEQLCVTAAPAGAQAATQCAPYVELAIGETRTIEAEGGALVVKRIQ